MEHNITENAVAVKLRALTRLQLIDTSLDRIHRLRGSLPEEVSDLEDDLEGLETRQERIDAEIEKLQQDIAQRKTKIDESHSAIKKYQVQQENVRNNREYEALEKEVEYANLEILTSEKKIRQFQEQIGMKKDQLHDTHRQIEDKKHELEEKQKELKVIVTETEQEEDQLRKASDSVALTIEERLLRGYRKIRNNMTNGLAVVTIDRDACGGCFSIVPPQTLIELKQRTRLIHCENCGRLLVDVTFFEEVGMEINALTTH
ncbi:MAG: zinc ribbon domain-containing protein [Bacteroidia bacterium]